jgi:hypothetical protein
MLARRFLAIIAVLTGLVIVGAVAWRVASDDIVRWGFSPSIAFADSPLPPAPDYRKDAAWVSRPGMADDPARWTPPGVTPAPRPPAAAFFVPPTAFLERARWNAPIDDRETNDRLALFTRAQASVFNGAADIWVPRYRQATFGAFLKPGPDADRALAVAFGDVEQAFAAFLAANPGDVPIILAGHSQGSRHLLRLLPALPADVRRRLVAVYVVGWPVALPEDLAAAGLPACAAGAAGCLASWQSFAADGDLGPALEGFTRVPMIDGRPQGTRSILCTNPLTGDGRPAGPERNPGTLIEGALEPRRAGGRCDRHGLLLVAPTPRDIGPFVLPGGNFHVYDYALFWAAIRADAQARLAAFRGA